MEAPSKAKAVVQTAALTIKSIDEAFDGPERPQLKPAIESWRRANGYPS